MPRATEPVIVRHPESGAMILLDTGTDWDADDIVVRTFPWAFVPKASTEPPTSVRIEAATAAPGEKRTVRRGR